MRTRRTRLDMHGLSAAAGTPHRPITRSIAGIGSADACANSPPTRIICGFSRRLHRVGEAATYLQTDIGQQSLAAREPSRPRRTTSLMVSSSPTTGASIAVTRRADMTVSRQPRLPHRHSSPYSSSVVCPISPAVPATPP